MPRFFGSFIPNLGDLDSSLGAAGHVSSTTYFSKFLEDKDRRFRANLTQPDSTSQPKARGLLHMECEFNHTKYKRRLDNYSRHEHLTISMQPRKYSEDTFKMESGRTRRRLQKYSEACSTRLRRARDLSDSGPQDCAHSVHILG
jgi:hypothetical protein